MKHYWLLLLTFLFGLSSCQSPATKKEGSEPGKIEISGVVTDCSNPIGIYGKEIAEEILPDSAGAFNLKGDLSVADFYSLTFGSEQRYQLYLKPGSKIHIEADYEKMAANSSSAVRISGEGSKESDLLYQLRVNSDRFGLSKEEYMEKYIPEVFGKNPDEFAAYFEDILLIDYTLIDEYVRLNPGLDATFVEHLKLNRMIDYNFNFRIYGSRRARLNVDQIEVPEKFDDYFSDRIPQNDMQLYEENSTYADYVRGKYYVQVEEELSEYPRESLEWYRARVEYLENCEIPEVILQVMWDGFTIGYMRTKDSVLREYITEIINEKVSDEAALARWEEFKAREAGYPDGSIAPDFTHNDINGNRISLSDFRGKLVYIDLWATWCVPCLEGVPYFDKMRDKYAGEKIVFLAISLDENVEAWRKKVKENKEGLFDGIQLNTKSYDCDISYNFVLSGIPQYVLIGADGRIIRKNAPRPHSEELSALLDSELKKI